MPQFDIANFAPQIAWLALFFAILYFVIVRATVPRLARVVDGREAKVVGDIAAADAAKGEADQVHDAYEADLAGAHVKAQAAIADAKASSIRDSEAVLGAAAADLHERTEKATASLELARARAGQEIETIAADAAAEIVSMLAGTRPDEETTRAAARRALAA